MPEFMSKREAPTDRSMILVDANYPLTTSTEIEARDGIVWKGQRHNANAELGRNPIDWHGGTADGESLKQGVCMLLDDMLAARAHQWPNSTALRTGRIFAGALASINSRTSRSRSG